MEEIETDERESEENGSDVTKKNNKKTNPDWLFFSNDATIYQTM